MTILLITFSIAVLVEIGLPLVLAVILRKRFNVGWALFGVGMLTFIGSQVIHLPLLSLLTVLFQQGILPQPSLAIMPYFNPIVLGLAAQGAGIRPECPAGSRSSHPPSAPRRRWR